MNLTVYDIFVQNSIHLSGNMLHYVPPARQLIYYHTVKLWFVEKVSHWSYDVPLYSSHPIEKSICKSLTNWQVSV